MIAPLRGQVFRVDLGHGAKPWVVLSNNARNRRLDTVLAARIATTIKNRSVPTVVDLEPGEPLVGVVLVDDLIQLYRDELTASIGALSPRVMAKISAALRIALP